jgi:nitroreductase
MDLSPAWYDAIAPRTSVRRYAPTPVPDDVVARLRAFCEGARPSANARVAIIGDVPDRLFTGVLGKLAGSYGRVEGAPLAAAVVGREGCEGEAGYVGEAFILEAATLGLGTCWIAASFDGELAAERIELAAGERIMALTPVGTSAEGPRGRRLLHRVIKAGERLPLETIAPGIGGGTGGGIVSGTGGEAGGASWPAWARAAVEAARLAPSGGNRQPWRFRFDERGLVLGRADKLYWTAPLDFGIAQLHVELGAAHMGVSGIWEPLAEPDVARFLAS